MSLKSPLSNSDDAVEFRPIEGLPAYRVGSDGSVWSNQRGAWHRIGQRVDKHGYLFVRLSHHGRVHHKKVHRIVAEAFLGPCPPGREVAHEDCDKTNARLSNLRYDTHKGNYADSVRVTNLNRGEKNGQSKLDESRVREIKRRLAAGENKYDLMAEFDIGRRCIERIWWGQRWGHVKLEGADLEAERFRKGITHSIEVEPARAFLLKQFAERDRLGRFG